MFGRNRKKPFDIIKEIEKIKECLCCVGIRCGETDLRQFLSIINEGEQYQVLTTIDNEVVWRDDKYVENFASDDWDILSIPETRHRRGVSPIVQVYELVDDVADYYRRVPNSDVEIRVSLTGTITITNLTINPTFDGKIIIM